MATILTFSLFATLLSIIACLVGGLLIFLRGGISNQRRTNTMMRWRVLLQGTALVLFCLILWLGHTG